MEEEAWTTELLRKQAHFEQELDRVAHVWWHRHKAKQQQ